MNGYFPREESLFPQTGWFPFKDGAAAYRFFLNDAIRFEKSLKVAIGFGKNEEQHFRTQFAKPGNELELSTTCYWYQTEPHAPLPPLPAAKDRAPSQWSWKDHENLPTTAELRSRGVKLHMRCGRPEQEVTFAEPGYSAVVTQGFTFTGWPFPIFHTRADDKDLQIDLTVPKNASGTLRLYMIDPDHFQGGRKQEIFVNNQSLGIVESFTAGKWLEHKIDASQTATGHVQIRVVNAKKESNAVMSIVEWVARGK